MKKKKRVAYIVESRNAVFEKEEVEVLVFEENGVLDDLNVGLGLLESRYLLDQKVSDLEDSL